MKANTQKYLKICCLVTTVLLILIILTLVILYFTILKPKQPEVSATSVNLKHIEVGFFPIIILQITLSADVYIKNKNYAGFKYHNTTTSLYYKDILIGEAPIRAGEIKARETQNVNTLIEIQPLKALADADFLKDLMAGTLKFTSDSAMAGDVILLKFLKLHAKTKVHCDITVFVRTKNSTASCVSTVKF